MRNNPPIDKPGKTAEELSLEIEKQTEEFLRKGGKIKNIPMGISGEKETERRRFYLTDRQKERLPKK